MAIKLVMLHAPEGVKLETWELGAAPLRIGKAIDNDWVITDMNLAVSPYHCVVTPQPIAGVLAEIKLPGSVLNQASQALGRHKTRKLGTGDHIFVGDYIIEVQVEGILPPATPEGLILLETEFVPPAITVPGIDFVRPPKAWEPAGPVVPDPPEHSYISPTAPWDAPSISPVTPWDKAGEVPPDKSKKDKP